MGLNEVRFYDGITIGELKVKLKFKFGLEKLGPVERETSKAHRVHRRRHHSAGVWRAAARSLAFFWINTET